MKRFAALFCFLFALALGLGAAPAHAAIAVQEVTSPGGITAWLVEDHALPLVAMQFAFRGGIGQDPDGKEGLASLTMNLLTEGAGPYDAAAFQQQLADRSIAMNFDAGRDALRGSVKSLSKDKNTAFNLLRMALTEPHFGNAAIARLRSEQLAAIRMQLGNPGWQARYALFRQIFGDHPYVKRKLGSTQTLENISRADITHFAAAHLARDNLLIAVAGDITPQELGADLDRVFGKLPLHARLLDIPELTWPQKTPVILTPRTGTQTELLFAMPGPKRDDPDWYAAEIANYILGGGGFASRLMHEVRDKRGLTYGIETALAPMEHAALFIGEAATDNDKTGEAWTIASDTMRRFYEDGVTDKEIQAAKDYLTGSLPLALTSTDKIAGVLVELQLEHLPRDYLEKRNGYITAVTPDDVERVIHRWFNPEGLTLSLDGKPVGITPTVVWPPVRN